jgi:pilus assembly protein CpaE
MDDLSIPPASTAQLGPSLRAVVYVRDRDTEAVIRQSLSDLGVPDVVFSAGNARTALTDLKNQASPRLLIVDVSDVDDPVAAIHELIEVCEPSTGVMAIGQSNDITLYRRLKAEGAAEYFFKPLVSALMTQACNRILSGEEDSQASRTGRLVIVMGVRGGVGATTIAVRTAWRLAESPPRPVVLMDLDLQTGDAALQLDATPSHALREALDRADRVDDLFLERGVAHITKRLDLLASLEPLNEDIDFKEQSLVSLLDILLRRYRYVIVDMPANRAVALSQVLHMPSILMLVSDAKLVSARDVARWRELIGPNTRERSTWHILNKTGAHSGLPTAEFIRAAGQAPDATITYSRDLGLASNLGIKAFPECPPLQRGLAPVFRRIAGDTAEVKRPLLQRLFG